MPKRSAATPNAPARLRAKRTARKPSRREMSE